MKFSMLSNLVLAPLFSIAASEQFATNDSVSKQCRAACSRLSGLDGPRFHYPAGDNFTIWDAKQQEVVPACRVEPSSAEDVAEILEIVVDECCHFAVEGGGHSRSPGDSNAIGGVTIDLDLLSHVTIAEDGASAQIGGGTTSWQAFASLQARGLSFVGGRVGQVGVGGFTLGGGTYPFSNKYGWALDNVYEQQVVLANSSIVTASETTNPDLYFALRGGANNFGIVTQFTVRTFPQGPIYISQVTWNDDQSEAVLDQVYRLFADPESQDVEASLDMYFMYNATSGQFGLTAAERYEKAMAHPAVFTDVDRIPIASRSTINATLASLTSRSPPLGVTRNLFDTLSILPARKVLSEGLQIFREEITAIKHVTGLTPNLICYPLPVNAIKHMKVRGGNALGIDQDEPLFIFLVSTSWADAKDDTAVTTMTNNVIGRMRSAAQSAGVAHPYMYLNYASAGRAHDVFEGYGAANVERLKSIQKEVDPQGIFTANGLWRGFMKLQ